MSRDSPEVSLRFRIHKSNPGSPAQTEPEYILMSRDSPEVSLRFRIHKSNPGSPAQTHGLDSWLIGLLALSPGSLALSLDLLAQT